MKTSSTIRRVARATDHLLLTRTLSLVDEGLVADEGDEPGVAIGLALTDDGVELALQPLDPVEPVTSLFGFICPPEWVAFGVLTRAHAHSVDEPDGPPAPVRFGLLVSRSGEQVTLVRPDGAEALAEPGPLGEGRVPDACRRALGLATPPPADPVGRLWALLWLESLMAESLAEPGSLDWLHVCRSHPAVAYVLDLDESVASELPHRFIEMVEIIGRQFDWERLRSMAVEGRLTGFGIPADDAAWMDDGMFSREVLGTFAPVDDMLTDLEPVTAPDVLAAVEHALDAWSVS